MMRNRERHLFYQMLHVPNMCVSSAPTPWAQSKGVCRPHGGTSSEESFSRDSRRQALQVLIIWL